MDIQPFTARVSPADLNDLRLRLEHIRWPDELPDVGWSYGVPISYVRRLVDHWRSGYDWRQWEARLNTYPQFVTEMDGQRIHFLHVRSPRADALPLILTHGWPGSVVEYLRVIDLLTTPPQPDESAFHLIIPSLPGFGFSGPTREPGWNIDRIARCWVRLMHGLGYGRYGAVGNDWGSEISLQVGRLDPDHVVGVHVTQIVLPPPTDPAELVATLPPEDVRALENLQWFNDNLSAYHTFQAQQPQTLAFALADSPAGWVAWVSQLYRDGIDDDFVLTNASLYWLTGTVASALRIYYEDARSPRCLAPTTTPTGLAMFRNDYRTFRTLATRIYKNLCHWSEFDLGGHWAAHQVPEVWTEDVRTFFRSLIG